MLMCPVLFRSHRPLLLLQPELLCVGPVVVSVLQVALVRAQARVGGGKELLKHHREVTTGGGGRWMGGWVGR